MNRTARLSASLLVPFLVLASCTRQPSPREACAKLEASGIARGCHETKPEGLGARAREVWTFDLPSVPGKGGNVFGFEKSDDYDATVKGFEGAAILAGPHRYGNPGARIFVQMNSGASLEIGKQTRAIIEGL